MHLKPGVEVVSVSLDGYLQQIQFFFPFGYTNVVAIFWATDQPIQRLLFFFHQFHQKYHREYHCPIFWRSWVWITKMLQPFITRSKTDCTVWKVWHYCVFPVNHSETNQSWGSVSSWMWKGVELSLWRGAAEVGFTSRRKHVRIYTPGWSLWWLASGCIFFIPAPCLLSNVLSLVIHLLPFDS